MSVMSRDPHDRCGSVNGTLRCVLRPHLEGDHLGLVPEGDPNARIETWARQDRKDVTLPDAPAVHVVPLFKVVPASAPTSEPAPRRPSPTSQGYTGETCETCQGMRMVRSGKCSTCQDCGASSGCS